MVRETLKFCYVYRNETASPSFIVSPGWPQRQALSVALQGTNVPGEF